MHRAVSVCMLLIAASCARIEVEEKAAQLDVNGFEHEVDFFHFGDRSSQFSGPLVLTADVPLGGEALESLSFGIDMTTVANDDEGVYDIQLVNLCSSRVEVELQRGGDTFEVEAAFEQGATECLLLRGGRVAGWIRGDVHFHAIDDEQADVTIPIQLGFTAAGEPDEGVEHSLRVAAQYDFTTPQ